MVGAPTKNRMHQQEKVYNMHEDHIDRPILITEFEDYDEDGSLLRDDNANEYPYWKVSYNPFGQVSLDYDSTGKTVCAYPYEINWLLPFRFPGQYADHELQDVVVYNHWRFYMPEIGRYTGPDKLDFQTG